MKNKKRYLSLFLSVLLVLSSIVFADTTYDGSTAFWMPTDDSVVDATEWTNYKTEQGLDPDLPESITNPNGTGALKFNKELWTDLHLVVYGDYSLVSPNDYKVVNGGYYTGGEYRYHGYDVSGNKHTNEAFPNDNTSTTVVQEKKWVYQPWEEISDGNDVYKRNVGDESVYNYFALTSKDPVKAPLAAKWINGLFTKEGENTSWFEDASTYDSVSDHNLLNYLSVQTAPTLNFSGQGVMIHIDSGGSWYQSFSTEPMKERAETPIVCTITDMLTTNYSQEGDVTILVKVEGDIEDEAYYGNEIDETIYYTRKDIASWTMTLSNSVTANIYTVTSILPLGDGTGKHDFRITIPKTAYEGIIDENGSFDVTFNATAIANYDNEDTGQDTDTKTKTVTGAVEEAMTDDDGSSGFVEFDIVAPHEILDVWTFPLSVLETDTSHAVDRYVTLNGVKLSEADEASFLNGTYKFPNLEVDNIYNYKITYVNDENIEFFYSSYVIVYDAVPRATVMITDPGKVNRKVTATSDISLTPQFVRDNSNVNVTEFSLTSLEGDTIYKGVDTLALKEFLIKEVGEVEISVTVGNEYGSRNYTHVVFEDQDYIPDIIANVWNSEMSREDILSMTAEGASIDGDTVGDLTYEIYYDTDQDGVTDTLIDSGTWDDTTQFAPPSLGWYSIKLFIKESFGQETIEDYITEDDYRTNTLERVFFVDNLIPMTKLFTNVEYSFPKLDVVIMNDEGITRDQNDYLKDNYVDIVNDFRRSSLDASVDIWDLYTYEYTQTAYKRTHDGKSYPKSTYYYNVSGYAGTLDRYDVDNYPYQVDEGEYVTVTNSKTATATVSNTVSIYYNEDGSHDRTTYSSGYSSLPSTKSYSSGGYTGTLSRVGDNLNKTTRTYYDDGTPKTTKQYWVAYYSGTVTKTTQVWESDYHTYNNYYGDYSGTVYKYVKQAYTPDYEVDSNKYIVYFATDSIINQADYDYIRDIARDATVILVANDGMQGALEEDYFILNSGDMDLIMLQIVGLAKLENPMLIEKAALVGEDIMLSYTDVDAEGDPLITDGFQYVQDPDYFDNSLGYETGAISAYDTDAYTNNEISSFNTVGKFTIYRRVSDSPVGFPAMGKASNEASLEVVVHRKPIALASLDWDFDPETGTYKTLWLDQSYDLDAEFSDANKGILDRKIRYRLTSSSNWIYEIPDNLSPGNYTLEYVVQDLYGVWSDTFNMNFNLSTVPGTQVNANLKSDDPQFSISALPASEKVEFYNIWTRYPYDVRLETALYNEAGTTRLASTKNTAFIEGVTGQRQGNDINWENIIYTIPETIEDGNYNMRITALDKTNSAIYAFLDLPFSVNTPIELSSDLSSIVGGQDNVITATTRIYADQVALVLFDGTTYSQSLNMVEVENDGYLKTWQVTYNAPVGIEEGDYQGVFRATTPADKVEVVVKNFELINVRIESFDVIGDWSYWDGKTDYKGKALSVMPHRFLSLENVTFIAEIRGLPTGVELSLSPELTAMYFTDDQGTTYSYKEILGYVVHFPLSLTMDTYDEATGIGVWSVTYILPLAPSSLDWQDARKHAAYSAVLEALTGSSSVSETIDDIEITGNIYDRVSLQPEYY